MEKSEIYKGVGSIASLILAPSGFGKTRSIKNLPPEKTYIINTMGKALPFLGAASKYKLGVNMEYTDRGPKVVESIAMVSRKPEIEYLVIDDAHYIMTSEFMRTVLVKGYEKFAVMAQNMWNVLLGANKLRDGLKVFLLAHDEYGERGVRTMRTVGKLVEEKLVPESPFPIVLFGGVSREESSARYYFMTQSDGTNTAKSPEDMFPYLIPNDLMLISDRIDEYYAGVPLENSKVDFDTLLAINTKITK
jgi:hypothetical protein